MNSCLIATILLAGSICIMISANPPEITGLTQEQRALRYEIEGERSRVTYTGIMLGIIIAWFYGGNYCDWGLIIVITTYLTYLLIPKETILTSLRNPHQIETWWTGYRHMQVRFYTGIAVALVASLIRTLGY